MPVFWLNVPGAMRASLAFRVGSTDETVPTRGITHLVEHLAISSLMRDPEMAGRVNANVGPLRTRFAVTGTSDAIATFLGTVTSNLTKLPLERLDDEKNILRTESANEPKGSWKQVWSARFGASGAGLSDFGEFGLQWLAPDAISEWASSRFSAGNAVLWLSGPPPANLRLNLAAGPRLPLADVKPLEYRPPVAYQQGDRWVVLSMLGGRSIPFGLATRILDWRIRERIRHELSIAYQVYATYHRLDANTLEVIAFADSLGSRAREAAEALLGVARVLAQEGARPDEMATLVAERRREVDDPDSGFGVLEQQALEELEGLAPSTQARIDEVIQALTPAAIAEAVSPALETAYLAVPRGVELNFPGFNPFPPSVGERIEGIRVEAAPGADRPEVIDYSDRGISMTTANEMTLGMIWEEVIAALWWSDGRRSLVSPDGSWLRVLPARLQSIEHLLETIRTHVPPDRWVPMDGLDET